MPPNCGYRTGPSRWSRTRHSVSRPRCSDTSPNPRVISSGPASSCPPGPRRRWAAGHGVGGVTSKRIFTFTLGPKIPAAAFHPAHPPTRPSFLLPATTKVNSAKSPPSGSVARFVESMEQTGQVTGDASGPLAAEQLDHLRSEGFLVANGLVPEQLIAAVIAAIEKTLNVRVHDPGSWSRLLADSVSRHRPALGSPSPLGRAPVPAHARRVGPALGHRAPLGLLGPLPIRRPQHHSSVPDPLGPRSQRHVAGLVPGRRCAHRHDPRPGLLSLHPRPLPRPECVAPNPAA